MTSRLSRTGLSEHKLAAPVIALFSGALITLSLAPFELWPCAVLGLYRLLQLLQTENYRRAAFLGWFFGMGMFGTGSSWVYVSIHVHGYAPVPLALILTLIWTSGLALLPMIFSYSYVRFTSPYRGAILFGFPALWVLFEWLRSWLLTGFPWLYVGYSSIDTWLSGWAPVSGVYGLSWAIGVSASCLFLITHHRNVQLRISAIVIMLCLWLGGLALQKVQWTEPRGSDPVITVAIVQGNIPQHLKWRPDYYASTLDIYRQMTKNLNRVDLIIWPEAAIPNYYRRAQSFLRPIVKDLKNKNTTLITGIPYQNQLEEKKSQIHNSILALGNGSGTYHKQRLVPFGEYVPFEKLLRGLIEFFDLPMSNFSPGEPNQALLNAGTLKLAPYICYEIVYPDLVREFAQDADMLITISNDSWFGDSIGPIQHLQMARMRALENGRFLIRSTNNGISAIIDSRGNIQNQSEQFVAQNLSGKAVIMKGRTLFSRTGSLPILIICTLLLAGVILNSKVSFKN